MLDDWRQARLHNFWVDVPPFAALSADTPDTGVWITFLGAPPAGQKCDTAKSDAPITEAIARETAQDRGEPKRRCAMRTPTGQSLVMIIPSLRR